MTPEIMSVREALNEAIAEKDSLYDARNSSIVNQVKYDIAVKRWARMQNNYEDMLGEALT